jgi:hypothetical protein
MSQNSDPLARIQARQHLETVNHYILHDEGEIIEAPGKISLVWLDPRLDIRRFLSVKAAGEDGILINGRHYPATDAGLKQGIRVSLVDLRQAG